MYRRGLLVAGALLGAQIVFAQEATPPAPEPLPPPTGRVLFSTEHGMPARPESPVPEAGAVIPGGPADVLPTPAVTDAEREAICINGYDLDVHLVPAEAREAVQAVLTVRNTSGKPVQRIPLQLSSTLRFQAISSVVLGKVQAITFTQSPVATDADHTGYAEEAVVLPSEPLPAGATLTLNLLYGGTVPQSSARLDLLGISPEKAVQTDWDQIAPTSDTSATTLRGFGDVLWYPVAAPLALFGDGNRLFTIAGEQKLANQRASIRLQLTVDYVGDPPENAIFNGELQPLNKVADGQDQVIEETHGVATANFARRSLGFRVPSLFLTAQKPLFSREEVLAAITPSPEKVVPYAAAAGRVQTLLSDWFGVSPLRPLTLLDHPGQPFQDDAFLVGQLAADAEVETTARLLVGPMTAAWFHSGFPWIADGLAEFMRLLWTERESGRKDAIAQLGAEAKILALAEPVGDATASHALVSTSSDVLYRVKAGAVWWQLRDLLGEDVLRQGLQAYRHAQSQNATFDADPNAMQRTLEKISGKELDWFFQDWVYRDAGLPDLSIMQVNTRALPARPGKETGYLVAVEVRNAGGAVADVPVEISAGDLTATERIRVPGNSVASVRIVFQGTPERVQVNDGSVPETGQSEHVFLVKSLR